MPELTPINFALIQQFSEKLSKEMLTWRENPMTWDQIVEQYKRIHNEK